MQDRFEHHVNTNLKFLKRSKLLIATSGGVDSVVLVHLCKALNLDIALAHCNFNLRGNESDTDEAFVIHLGEALDVEVFIQNFDTEAYAKENKCSIQMAARELRYDWFEELATQLQFNYVLTAHHADDNLETFLINFTRGTGLNGLTGIPSVNGNTVRPLLLFSRDAIETYAKENNIEWREDSSNTSRKYLRNKLRYEVVPILKEINPQLLDSFQNTLDYLGDTASIVQQTMQDFLSECIVASDDSNTMYLVSAFKAQTNPKAYLFEVLKTYGFTEWNDVVHLLDAESGKYVSSNTHRLLKHREYLILTQLCHSEQSEESLLINIDETAVKTPLGILFFDEADALKNNTATEIYVDKAKLKFPLEIRTWQQGDVFQPIGMKGKKKVSKYLKDERLSLIEKENTFVLTSDNSIVWVIGRRADDRYKVTDQTAQILKLKLG